MEHTNDHMTVGERTKIWFPFYSNFGTCIVGDDCTLHSHLWISDGVIIGNRVKIEAFTFIPNGVTIEDDVFIGPHVTFTNDKHPPSPHLGLTVVKRGAVIGAGSVILPVILGEGCIIGAGSVVTKNIPPHEVWVGNPARFLRQNVNNDYAINGWDEA